MDGDGQRSSTNGTWLFLCDMYEMRDDMIFKAGQNLFQVVFRQACIVSDFD